MIHGYRKRIKEFRDKLVLKEDTSYPSTIYKNRTDGHCAVVAALFYKHFGGLLRSTIINGQSHWFNMIYVDGKHYDVDLTGDQFGFPEIQIKDGDTLYTDIKIRTFGELNRETLDRIKLVEERSFGNRTIFGQPIRKSTTGLFYPCKITLDYFINSTHLALDTFKNNMIALGEEATSPRFIEKWFEVFMAWHEVEEER